MSVDYFVASDVAGTLPLTGVLIVGAEPGKIVPVQTIFVVKAGDTDATELLLSAALATRKLGVGSLADGWEVVEEKWLEALVETSEEWTAIGGGPSVGDLELTADDFTENICPVQLRLNIPNDPASAGDVSFAIEVFFK